MDLTDKEDAKEFYEQRYETSYMQLWPPETTQRVSALISELHLPPEGCAIDFGCGNGVFTDVLSRALPNWKIFGVDFSENALRNAASQYHHCTFFNSDKMPEFQGRFDFAFTHHVLEHIYDLEAVLHGLQKCMKPSCSILHILPCGNEGSLEHRICSSIRGGVEEDSGNRFFFEDPGHLRRMKTNELISLMNGLGFSLDRAVYKNHFWGAVQWISQSRIPLILRITDYRRARNARAAAMLLCLRVFLVILRVLRAPAQHAERLFLGASSSPRGRLNAKLFYLLVLPCVLFDKLVRSLSRWEYRRKSTVPRASEMALSFTMK